MKKEEIYKKIIEILEKKYSKKNKTSDVIIINKIFVGGRTDFENKLSNIEFNAKNPIDIQDVANASFNRILKNIK